LLVIPVKTGRQLFDGFQQGLGPGFRREGEQP
jgi:hypothetical protein